MSAKKHPLGPYFRRFLIEDTLLDRNLSRNTQASYRDTFVLLLRFMEGRFSLLPEQLCAEDVTPSAVREFLTFLKEKRGNSDATRNLRLTALHSLFRFIARQTPELVGLSSQIQALPPRKCLTRTVPYLEKDELDAVLRAPDRATGQGRREHALLLFLYNTGTRADEAAQLEKRSVYLGPSPYVKIVGKGRKERLCPLWKQTAKILAEMLQERGEHADKGRVFLNTRGKPLTRFGVRGIVRRMVAKAAQVVPSLKQKAVSTHAIRHTTAVHLLRAGVDINTIRAWLGHVSLDTTHRYAEVDLKAKAEALQTTAIPIPRSSDSRSQKRQSLLTFLSRLTRDPSELCD